MDLWISHSNPAKQTLLALACLIVGALLTVLARHAELGHMSNESAGFLLGLLLLGIGIAGFLVRGRQKIVVDPRLRVITIEDTTAFGIKMRTIAFDDITHIGIGYLGKASNFVRYYYLSLTLRNGEHYPLFAPGRFYEGSSDRAVVEGWRHRLEEYLNRHG